MQKNKKSTAVARKAWRFLRLALLWARKGGILKNRLVLAKHLIKTIRNSTHNHFHLHQQHRSDAIGYGERELSFDDTPVIHVRMHRPSSLRFKMPNIPCINNNPPVLDFDYDFGQDDEDMYINYYNNNGHELQEQQQRNDDDDDDEEVEVCEEMKSPRSSSSEEEGIDTKAEEFIAKFYQQMKLQRQISYLQYNEMITRGAN